ncbi:Sodium/hydrogen exchanger family-domain-containing protein [Collybia nuda]|uniref:Sodium/hydrogen exchanger family-domain-containing protein n=1 Tax=Collybia nuda TaxID=64659 RepID=A0A9P6CB90_9AGAR|nr:Sodium/hydrogen exchanger family-domain-containing protein [Collybia nuda]
MSMYEFSSVIITLFYDTIVGTDQRVLSGSNASIFNPSGSPIRLWIIQAGIIVSTASVLSLGLRRLRQPKVIAEVLGGILLGPTGFGRIPGFTDYVFPMESRPYLGLVADIGLCLFLFLVGLEIDGAVIRRNARLSVAVAIAGMILPFGFGIALAGPLYRQFVDPNIQFFHFTLFIGVAFSITAFPVLCRILTELKLLDTTVGIVVLSAGVGNDIIGWALLALSVTLVKAGSQFTALWILLSCVGWTMFLLFPVRSALRWLAKTTGSIENGPTMLFMTVTMLVLFGSAFFTDVIGVHAIFGAFVAGIIVPREGGLAIALTEKLEDMVTIIFLPLYFTLSGLSTDLGLLDDAVTAGFTVVIIMTAFAGKFGGCTLAAKYAAGFNWREASAVGSLMSCKGLVELIVLNVGLSAGILSQRVFSMFVLEALVLTFMTTPLVMTFYPPHLRTRISPIKTQFDHLTDDETGTQDETPYIVDTIQKRRFTVVLDKLEHLPGAMALTQLIQPSLQVDEKHKRIPMINNFSSKAPLHPLQFSIEAHRIIELDRTSITKSSAPNTHLNTDPLLAIFRMHGQLHNLPITSSVSVIPRSDIPNDVVENARKHASDMIMVSWLPPSKEDDEKTQGSININNPTTSNKPSNNPFGALFRSPSGTQKPASAIQSQSVRRVFTQSGVDVALFVDRAASRTELPTATNQHVFLPFFGGPDDRLALEFVVQICESPKVTATVLRMVRKDDHLLASPTSTAYTKDNGGVSKLPENVNMLSLVSVVSDSTATFHGETNSGLKLQSEVADNISWARYAEPRTGSGSNLHPAALSRIQFRELETSTPLRSAIQECSLNNAEGDGHTRLLIVTGRSVRPAFESHRAELEALMREHWHDTVDNDMKRTIGDIATAFILTGCGAGVVVMQAAPE